MITYEVTYETFHAKKAQGGTLFYLETEESVELWLQFESYVLHSLYTKPVQTYQLNAEGEQEPIGDVDTEYLLWKDENLKSGTRVLGLKKRNVEVRFS